MDVLIYVKKCGVESGPYGQLRSLSMEGLVLLGCLRVG